MNSTDVIQPLPMSGAIAYNGSKNTIPQDATGSELASVSTGFPDITMKALADGGLPPRGQDCNGLFYLSTDQKVYLQNGGIITFNQEVSNLIGGYPKGAILDYYESTSGEYKKVISLIDDNTNNFIETPTYIDNVNWKEIFWSNTLTTSNLTNYILSAPNGVFSVEADGLTVSIKKGLTLLMPDGRDEDNNLKNYKHVVEEEFSYTLTNFTTTSGRFVLVLASNNTVGWGTYTNIDYIPTINRGTWIRHIYSNKIYVWNDTTQSYNENPRLLGVIGRVDITNGKILAQGQFYPGSLLKESDIPSLSNVSLPSPQIRGLVLGANGTRYTALQNGYIHLAGTSTTAQCALELVNQTSGYHDYSPGAYALSFVTANIPVVVGDVFQANVTNVTPQFFQINYACGVV